MSDDPGDDGGMNMLAGTNRMPSIAVPVQGQGQPAQQPGGGINHGLMQQQVVQRMRAMSPEDVMRHRDVAGREMETLASVASGSRTMSRADVAAYLGSLAAKGDINPAEMQEMLTVLPHTEQGIRQWARAMFSVAMLRGIHGHAAYPLSLYPSTLGADEAGQAPDDDEQPDDQEQQPDATGEEAASG